MSAGFVAQRLMLDTGAASSSSISAAGAPRLLAYGQSIPRKIPYR